VQHTATVLGTIADAAESERARILAERPDLAGELLTPADVMRVLHIGRTRYQELIASGELPSFKPGRERLVRASDLRVWIATVVGRL
jgi:excisionase family DNA binding protein